MKIQKNNWGVRGSGLGGQGGCEQRIFCEDSNKKIGGSGGGVGLGGGRVRVDVNEELKFL